MAALEREFSLGGMLVFNGLYECKVPADFDFETVLLSLPGFEEGTAESPGDGFTRLPLDDVLDSRPSLGRELRDELREFDHIRYTAEQYDRTVAEVDGERRAVSVPSEREVDLHWRFPDLLAARGSREDTEQAIIALEEELDDEARIREFGFDPRFLRGLFRNPEAPEGLTVERITEIDLRSTSGKFGQVNRVSATGESIAPDSLSGTLDQEHEIASLGGVFGLNGYEIHATVSTDGRVHVRAAGDIQSEDDYGRMFLGLGFLDRLVRTYRNWDSGE
jgi:hypothetical protein